MLDVSFVLLYFVMPFFILKLMHFIDIKIFTLSIPSFLMISMFVYSYIGLLTLYFGWNEYRFESGVQDKLLVFQVYMFSVISMFGLILGFAYSKYILKLSNIYCLVKVRALSSKEINMLVLLLLFCFGVLLVYISKLSSVAIFVIVNDTISDSKLARSLMGNDFSGKYHWYSLVMHDILNVVTFILYSAYLVSKRKVVLLLFLISFMGSTFGAIMATEKGPFAWILIGLFLTYCLTILNGKMPIKGILKLVMSLLLVLLLFYIYFMGDRDIYSGIMSILSRTFTGGIQPAYHYLEFFPNHQEFLYGKS